MARLELARATEELGEERAQLDRRQLASTRVVASRRVAERVRRREREAGTGRATRQASQQTAGHAPQEPAEQLAREALDDLRRHAHAGDGEEVLQVTAVQLVPVALPDLVDELHLQREDRQR